MDDEPSTEGLFEQMFAIHHQAIVSLSRVGGFEEWSPLEILALRVFARNLHPIGVTTIAHALGMSVPHSSRIATRLRRRGVVSESRWHQYRSLSLTDAGRELLREEEPYFSRFASGVFDGVCETDRAALFRILERVRGNVRRSAYG